MQPDQQQNNPNQVNSGNINEMYTPGVALQEPIQTNNDIKQPVVENAPIRWSSSEFIYREKSSLWFISFVIIVIILILSDIFLLKSYTFSILVLVMAAAVVVFLRRPPRVINYALSGNHGLYVGERLYHFNEFKAFGIIQDEGYNSIMLIPIKRFSPGVSVYFPQEVGEQIVDVFGARLPMENIKLDVLDIIVKKLRI
ncbi:hypothetical protein CVV43_03710 [Candidatus Saccharibacteria bacterium HGW-Saccharibacteria-1]|jgi:hypothetical protein|nr:MAG: hypothetical protein CVV43_03710 [Candidatus Saccharibacteria bacterium HGW-Saccharibacteria-1]